MTAQDVLEGTLVVNTPEAWDCKAINVRYSIVFFCCFGFDPYAIILQNVFHINHK